MNQQEHVIVVRPDNPAGKNKSRLGTSEFLRMAVSLGLFAGLVEGLFLLAVFRYGCCLLYTSRCV